MSRKLHLICMDVIQTFHTSVKRRKITFNSYNYNFFRHSFLFSRPIYNYVFLKITFPANNASRILTMTRLRR